MFKPYTQSHSDLKRAFVNLTNDGAKICWIQTGATFHTVVILPKGMPSFLLLVTLKFTFLPHIIFPN